MSSTELAAVSLPEKLLTAVDHGRTLRRAALRRQVRYLAKLLDAADHDAIRAAVEAGRQGSAVATARLHRIERWRDRLLSEGDSALSALIEQCPDLDRQKLRQLVRAARRDQAQQVGNKAFRVLFRWLGEQDL